MKSRSYFSVSFKVNIFFGCEVFWSMAKFCILHVRRENVFEELLKVHAVHFRFFPPTYCRCVTSHYTVSASRNTVVWSRLAHTQVWPRYWNSPTDCARCSETRKTWWQRWEIASPSNTPVIWKTSRILLPRYNSRRQYDHLWTGSFLLY